MNSPNESSARPSEPVRPADEETVQALRKAIRVELINCVDCGSDPWWDALDAARAVVASEPWQRLVRERGEARAAVARVEALAQQWAALAPADDWGDDMASTVQADLGRSVLAALRGDAEEASEPQAQGVDAPDLMAALRRSLGLPEESGAPVRSTDPDAEEASDFRCDGKGYAVEGNVVAHSCTCGTEPACPFRGTDHDCGKGATT